MRALLALALLCVPSIASAQHHYFEIHVVDATTSAPVPCATLRTVSHIALRSDSTGTVAFYEPGLMATNVWFYAEGDGITHAADGFGFHGEALAVTESGSATMRVTVMGAPTCDASDVESRRIARGVPAASGFFRIDVIDAETERGVPLAELRLDGVAGDFDTGRWVTDSAGVIAIDPLDLEGAQTVSIASHGYTFDDDSVTLDVRAGGTLTIRAHRDYAAERLYRVTGGGIYRHSALLDLPTPTAAPQLSGFVLGQDSDFSVVHDGHLFWIWGDTNRPSYPLGNFHTSGATSVLPDEGGLDPEEGVDFTYFVDANGFARAMAPTETVPGDGVTWLSSLVSVPNAHGDAVLHATFGMFASLTERTRFGMLTWDETHERFVDGVTFDGPDEQYPNDDGFPLEVAGASWIYYENHIRIPARSEAMLDPTTYEAFSPIVDGVLMRDAGGVPAYAWRAGGVVPTTSTAGLAASEELLAHVRHVDTGQVNTVHGNGALIPNEHAGRYIRLVTPISQLGETWLALADSPLGPWAYARPIVHHEQYTFYNPRQHPAFDRAQGQRTYFDATYVTSFSGNDDPTPRYDYNQMMYAIDVDRPELALPTAIYRSAMGELGSLRVLDANEPPITPLFMAPDREAPGTVPVWWSGPSCEARTLMVGGTPTTPPIFWALPLATPLPHQTALIESRDAMGDPVYGVTAVSGGRPIALVWASPIAVPLPIAETLIGPHPDAGADRCLDTASLVLAAAASGTHWEIDGHTVAGTMTLPAGVTTVELVATRADGLVRRDWMLVRVGEAPPIPPPAAVMGGCACRAAAGADDAGLGVGILAIAAWITRRRRSRQSAASPTS